MFYYRKRRKRKFILVCILLSLFLLFYTIETKAAPIILKAARNTSHSVAMEIIQKSIAEKFASVEIAYEDLMHIEKDNDGNIILIIPNSAQINQTVSAITLNIDEDLKEMSKQKIAVPLGTITGSKLFAGIGPDIKVSIKPIGAVHISVKDDFVSVGINQSRHRIWLEIEAEMMLMIPFDSESFTVSSSVILCEGIIVGPVPQTYLNFGDGLNLQSAE